MGKDKLIVARKEGKIQAGVTTLENHSFSDTQVNPSDAANWRVAKFSLLVPNSNFCAPDFASIAMPVETRAFATPLCR